MQSATDASVDYSGASNQTYLFDNNPKAANKQME